MEGKKNNDGGSLQAVIKRFGALKPVDISRYGTKASAAVTTKAAGGTDVVRIAVAEQLMDVPDAELDAALDGFFESEPEILDALAENGVVQEPHAEEAHPDIDAALADVFPALEDEGQPVELPPVYCLTPQGKVVEKTKLGS